MIYSLIVDTHMHQGASRHEVRERIDVDLSKPLLPEEIKAYEEDQWDKMSAAAAATRGGGQGAAMPLNQRMGG